MLREKSRQLRDFIAFTDNIEKEYFQNFNIFLRTNKPEIAFTVQRGNVITLQCRVQKLKITFNMGVGIVKNLDLLIVCATSVHLELF